MYIYIYIYATSLKWYCSTCPLQFRFATTQTLTTSPQAERTETSNLEVSRAKGAISRHLIRLINPVLFGVRLLVITVSTGAALLNVDTPADHQHLRGYHQYDGTTLLNHHHLVFFEKKGGGNGNAWPNWKHIAWKLMVGRPSFPFPFKMVPLKKGHLLIFGGAIVDIKFSGINLKLDSNSNVIQLFKCMKLVTRPWNSLSSYIYIIYIYNDSMFPIFQLSHPKLTNRFVFRVGFFGGRDLLSLVSGWPWRPMHRPKCWLELQRAAYPTNAPWNVPQVGRSSHLFSVQTKGRERNLLVKNFSFLGICAFWGWLMYVFFKSDSKR